MSKKIINTTTLPKVYNAHQSRCRVCKEGGLSMFEPMYVDAYNYFICSSCATEEEKQTFTSVMFSMPLDPSNTKALAATKKRKIA